MPGIAGGAVDRGSGGATTCAECQSIAVRPSRSSYPMDKEKNPDGRIGFWRCSHCGARFQGPPVFEGKRRRRSRGHDPLDKRLGLARLTKRWAFPLIVILVTALAVAFILDRRNSPAAPPIITPRR